MPTVPLAIAYSAAAISMVGTGVAAYSAYESGQNQAALARYNAANQQAQNQYQLTASAAKSLAQREQNRKILAEQEGAYVASGVVVNTGSPLTVESKQASLLELRAVNTDYEGATGYRMGQGALMQDQMTADAASRASKLGATATILSGVGNTSMSALALAK